MPFFVLFIPMIKLIQCSHIDECLVVLDCCVVCISLDNFLAILSIDLNFRINFFLSFSMDSIRMPSNFQCCSLLFYCEKQVSVYNVRLSSGFDCANPFSSTKTKCQMKYSYISRHSLTELWKQVLILFAALWISWLFCIIPNYSRTFETKEKWLKLRAASSTWVLNR